MFSLGVCTLMINMQIFEIIDWIIQSNEKEEKKLFIQRFPNQHSSHIREHVNQ